ncbi:putative uncharacterized protein [Parabacteroides sp. CAG:409]|nr:putative uncharacterized protein [Parabacteroides sp. CAG:409]
MKKKVLIIHRGYPLGSNAGDKVRTLNMAKSLQRIGFQVFLLGFYTKGFSLKKKEIEQLPNGIKPLFYFTLPNRFHLHHVAALYRAILTWLICKYYSIDLVQGELASAANCVRFLPKLPLITDFHSDIVPELEMDGYLPYQIENARSENVYAIKRSAKTITVSANLRKNLSVYGTTDAPNYVLPCNFVAEPYLNFTMERRKAMRIEYGLDDRILLCYSGGLHVWQCISETINLVIELRKHNPAYFLCIFTNDSIEPYKDKLSLLENSYMVKSLKHDEVPTHLLMADVGFVLRANSLVNINSSPTKTSEYMAAGMMVVATQYAGDVPQLIHDSGCGYTLKGPVASPDEIKSLDLKITEFMSNRCVEFEKSRKFIFEHRVWEVNECILNQLYQDL